MKTWTCYEQIEQAMEEERQKTDTIPLTPYPIKVSLYQHQIKAANMAALLFGFIDSLKEGRH